MQGQVPEHGLSPATAGQRQDTVWHFVCNVMPRLTDASRRREQPRRLGGGQAQGRPRDACAHARAAGSQPALHPRHGGAVEPVTTRAGRKSNTASKYDGDGGAVYGRLQKSHGAWQIGRRFAQRRRPGPALEKPVPADPTAAERQPRRRACITAPCRRTRPPRLLLSNLDVDQHDDGARGDAMYSGGWTVSLNGLLLDSHKTSHSSASGILALACFLLRFCFVVPSQSGATRKRKPRARLARPRDRRLQAASRANKGRMRAACLLSICPQPPNPCPAKQGLASAAVPQLPSEASSRTGWCVSGSPLAAGTERANKRASFLHSHRS